MKLDLWCLKNMISFGILICLVSAVRTDAGLGAPLSDGPISPDGRRLLTGDSEGSGTIWHAEAGAELISIGRHPCAITSVSFSSDGLSIITVCRDGTVRLLPALDWKLSEQEAAEEQVERWRRSLVDKGGYDGG
jgi:WD40 repeat protein